MGTDIFSTRPEQREARSAAGPSLALWGGVECTINRVHDEYHTQLERNGHALHLDDLERFAALGITAIRYPVLWERTAPHADANADWTWSDQRLPRLRELGIAPIVGLLHHGSGPRDTSLVDPRFPEQFALYAGAVAARYPWVERWTPINEPLTTARFSGLYGAWYPHGRSEKTFCTALLNQCKGIVLAMAAIRDVRPGAQLIQTEDLGKTYSTPSLHYQALFNNALRWLAWDLLCGSVNEHHYLWRWLVKWCGARPEDLLWFSEHRCVPDLLGANHYVTSERVLDDRLENYPEYLHGGNGRHQYVDVEAARCLAQPTDGLTPLLDEAWQRYGIPIAVTEAHIDSTRDDHMRWIVEVWRAAEEARKRGVDVRAVTVWSLLGSFDWNSLVTQPRNYYEPGAFDVRGPHRRPTAIAHLMRNLAQHGVPEHPVLSSPGWWRRPGRLIWPPVDVVDVDSRPAVSGATRARHADEAANAESFGSGAGTAPLLVTGATGTLGRAFARICNERGLHVELVGRQAMDIADPRSVEQAAARYQPWAIINAAGYVRVDDAEQDADRCFRENVLGPCVLARFCADNGLPLVTFSSDLVFDGTQQTPYLENDPIAPLNVYGRSKADAEAGVLERHPGALVVRTSAFFGPWDAHNHVTIALRTIREGRPFAVANDLTVSPTYVPDLVNACLDLLIDRETGIWHLTNGDAMTWADFALRAVELAQLDSGHLQPRPSAELRLAARRPVYSALGSGRSSVMPSLDSAMHRYFAHYHAIASRGDESEVPTAVSQGQRLVETEPAPAPRVRFSHGKRAGLHFRP